MCARSSTAAAGLLCVSVLSTGGCGSPTASDGPSWMTAIVEEADSAMDYVGGGNYGTTNGFSIVSHGAGSSVGQTVIFVRTEEDLPTPGEYSFEAPGGAGFVGYYLRTLDDGTREKFVVASGAIDISISARDQVSGTFDFAALLYCSTPPDEVQDECAPETLIDGAPPVLIRGSFGVGPHGPISVG